MAAIKYDPEKVIDDYRAAYLAANKKTAPAITYQGGGWFKISGMHKARWRYRDIKGSTDRLQMRATERQS